VSISVIIPTFNAQNYLPRLLESLQNQTVDFELIIIDSSSTDNTLQIAKKYTKNIITIKKEEFDHGATRTKAATNATGDIVVFLTQDALPASNDAIEKLTNILIKNKDVGAVYGRQLPKNDASIFGEHLRYFNYPEKSYIKELKDKDRFGLKCAFFSDSFSAYKKEVLEELNYFKEGTIVGEDMHIVARMLLKGYKKAYCADAKVYHSHNYTVIEDFMRYFDTGVFHTKESWLIDKFGKAEGEGKRFVKSEFNFLLQKRAYYKIPEFFIRNGMKLLGYKLGKKYQNIPLSLAKKLSMHKAWWDKWA
jgi:rhamnosyltransferase